MTKSLVNLSQILGLEALLTQPTTTLTEAEIQDLMAQRKQARLAKNYAQSDRLRSILQQTGIAIVDLPNGETLISP
jgi:cysteinyl-tRNA synthetase